MKSINILLVTQNVGRLFDAPQEAALTTWAAELRAWADGAGADFVALHAQELGGKAGKKGGMPGVDAFRKAISAAFPEYWCSECLCETDTTELPPSPKTNFTAIGSLFLVRSSVAARVQAWSFASNLWGPLESSSFATHARHASFARHLFDALSPSWTRKGFLLTRWRVDVDGSGQWEPFGLLNVHLFHDEDNVRALQRSGPVSDYAVSRQQGLAEALQFTPRLSNHVLPSTCYPMPLPVPLAHLAKPHN